MSATQAPDTLQADSKSPALTSWDCLPALDLGLEPDLGTRSMPQAALQADGNISERLKETNRKAQRRWREKNKVQGLLEHRTRLTQAIPVANNIAIPLQEREQTTDAQLAEATSQLRQLKVRQRELIARNNVLEKVAALHKEPKDPGESCHFAGKLDDTLSGRQVCSLTDQCYMYVMTCTSLTTQLSFALEVTQADEIEFLLNILEQEGLRRTQQGAAMLLSSTPGQDKETNHEVTVQYLTTMPRNDLVHFRTVRASSRNSAWSQV